MWVKAVKHVKALGDLPFRIAGGNGGKGAAGTQGRRGEEIAAESPGWHRRVEGAGGQVERNPQRRCRMGG